MKVYYSTNAFVDLIDISAYVKYDTLSITVRGMSDDFHMAQNEASLDIIYEASLYPTLKALTGYTGLYITEDDGTPMFKGEFAPPKSRRLNGILDNTRLSIRAVDFSRRLKKQVGDVCYGDGITPTYWVMNSAAESLSLVHILARLSGDATFTPSAAFADLIIPDKLAIFTPSNENEDILSLLNTLCFEYGYAFGFDESGKIAPKKWKGYAGIKATELVNQANTTIVGLTATKSSGTDGTWNAACRGTTGIVGAQRVDAIINAAGVAFGLDKTPTSSASYTDLDYAILAVIGSTDIKVYTSGTDRGTLSTWVTGDVFSIIHSGTVCSFQKNGVEFYSYTNTETSALYFDSSIATTGSSFTLLERTALVSITEAQIQGELEINYSEPEYDGAEVAYYEVGTSNGDGNGILVYQDPNCQPDGMGGWVGVSIPAGLQYPYATNIDDDTSTIAKNVVYQEYTDAGITYFTNYAIKNNLDKTYYYKAFSSDFTDILRTSNHALEWKAEGQAEGVSGDISLETGTGYPAYGNKKARIVFKNNSVSSKDLEYFNIRATVNYKATRRTSIVKNITDAQNINTYESLFILPVLDTAGNAMSSVAKSLAISLANQYKVGGYEYSFGSTTKYEAGSHPEVQSTTDSLTQSVTILSRDWDGKNEQYSYKARAFGSEVRGVDAATYASSGLLQVVRDIPVTPVYPSDETLFEYNSFDNQVLPEYPDNVAGTKFLLKDFTSVGSWSSLSSDLGIGYTQALPLVHSTGVLICGLTSTTTKAGFLRSADGGVTWKKIQISTSSFNTRQPIELSTGRLLATSDGSAGQGDVWYSDDVGLTWNLSSGFTSGLETVTSLANLGSGIILAGTGASAGDGDIWRSIDYGSSFTKIHEAGTGYETVYVFKGQGNYAFAGTGTSTGDGDTLWSSNLGATWNLVEMGATLGRFEAILDLGGGVVLAGSGNSSGIGYIYRSIDYGQSYTQIILGAAVDTVRQITQISGSSNILANTGSGAGDGDVYISSDAGASWTKIEFGASFEYVFAVMDMGGGYVLAGTGQTAGDGNIYLSTDYGASFTLSYDPGSAYEFILAFATAGSGTWYAASGNSMGDGDLFKTTDYGANWTKIELQNTGTLTTGSNLLTLTQDYMDNGIAVISIPQSVASGDNLIFRVRSSVDRLIRVGTASGGTLTQYNQYSSGTDWITIGGKLTASGTQIGIVADSAPIGSTLDVKWEYAGDGVIDTQFDDSSANDNKLTPVGGVEVITGISGNAVKFDGGTGYLTGTVAGLTTVATVSFWNYFEAFDTTARLVFDTSATSFTTVGAIGILINHGSVAGRLRVRVKTATTFLGGYYVLPAAGLYHISVAVDLTIASDDAIQLYLNGSKVNLTYDFPYSGAGTLPSLYNGAFYIHAVGGSSSYLNGWIDEFRIDSVALTPANIRALYTTPGRVTPTAVNNVIPQRAPKYWGRYLDSAPTTTNVGDTYTRYSTTSGSSNRGVFKWDGAAWTRTEARNDIMLALSDISFIIAYRDTSTPPVAIYVSDILHPGSDYTSDSTTQADFAFFGAVVAGYIEAQDIKVRGSIRGGDRYDETGAVVDDTVDGFSLLANGACKLAGATFDGTQGGTVSAPVVTSCPGKVWVSRTDPFGTVEVWGIAHDGSRVVVASAFGGKIARSTDGGVTWGSLITNPFTGVSDPYALAWGNSVFVMGGTSGKIARSTDGGVTWGSLITNPFAWVSIFSIQYSDGVWIALGSSGAVSRSTDDGATWGALVSTGLFPGNVIIKTPDAWVAGGGSGKIARSTDGGVTWGSLISTGMAQIEDLCLGGGVMVAVGVDGEISRSLDYGLTWSSLISNPFGSVNILSVAYGGGVFVAVGRSGRVARSLDGGLTWSEPGTTASYSPFGDYTYYNKILYCPDSKRFVAGGYNYDTDDSLIITSDYLEAGGGIVERGTTASGTYTKYGDGTLRQWVHGYTIAVSGTTTWTFPVPFIDTNYALGTPAIRDAEKTFTVLEDQPVARTASSVNLTFHRFSGSVTYDVYADLTVEGRWY